MRIVPHSILIFDTIFSSEPILPTIITGESSVSLLSATNFRATIGTNITTVIGNNITFVCVAEGLPRPSVSWWKGDLDLNVNQTSHVVYASDTDADRGVFVYGKQSRRLLYDQFHCDCSWLVSRFLLEGWGMIVVIVSESGGFSQSSFLFRSHRTRKSNTTTYHYNPRKSRVSRRTKNSRTHCWGEM